MIQVIGSKSCSRCDIVKKVLNDKGIEFSYTHYADMTEQEKVEVNKHNQKQLPIIIKDGTLITVQEVSKL